MFSSDDAQTRPRVYMPPVSFVAPLQIDKSYASAGTLVLTRTILIRLSLHVMTHQNLGRSR